MKYLPALLLAIPLLARAQTVTAPIEIHSLTQAAPLTGNGTEWLPMDQGLCPSCTFKVSPQQLATFVLAQPFTINASNITQGTLPCAQLPSFSGAFTTNGCVASISGIAAGTLYGNPTSGNASPIGITLGTGLSFSGTTLNASTSVSFTSPDGSLGITGSPSASLTAIVNASNIVTGSISPGILPALTGNSVQLVSTGNITNLCGLPFIDGFNGTDMNYILLSHETNSALNGIWQMHLGACPGSGNWTYPTWFQLGSTTQAVNNMTVVVNQGTNYGGTTWSLQFAPTPVVIGTTSQSWFINSPKSIASNGGLIGVTDAARASYFASILDYTSQANPWSGTIRKNYGNSNTFGGSFCILNSNQIELSEVTVPTSYNGANAEIPGCGFPGASNGVNPGAGVQSFTFADGGDGYMPQQTLQCLLGTGTPCEVIVYSTIVNALPNIASGGASCTPGTQTFTGTTGIAGTTGTSYFTVTGSVNGSGVLASLSSFVANGPYSQKPINWYAEPVSGGGCVTPPTLDLSQAMGANTGSVYVAGNYTATPALPVTFTSMALPLNSLSWASTNGGTVTATIKSLSAGSASTLPGWMYPGFTAGTSTLPVTISGATPSGYNGTYTATVSGPGTFAFPLASNPGAETVPGTYTISPTATGADANLNWYGNSLVGTISNIVQSGGNTTFTISNPAGSTLNNGGGKVYLWKGTDDAAFTAATGTGAQAILLPSPPVVTGFESGYMITNGIGLGGNHRWTFDCMGGFISGADNAGAPNSGSMLSANSAGDFRSQAASTILRCDLDAAGGFLRNLTVLDWDWDVCLGNLFENATGENIGWSYGGHSRESRLCHFKIINDGYNPLTFPILGIDSEAPDTRISDGDILQGFQQTAIYNGTSTGDVNVSNVHGEQVVGGPTFLENGAGNRWFGGNQADSPAPGFPGLALYGSFNTIQNTDVLFGGPWAGQLGILAPSAHSTLMGNTPNRGNMPAPYACIDLSGGGLSTNGEKNTWIGNIGCSPIPIGLPSYTVATLPACAGSTDTYTLAAVTDAVSPTYNGTLTGGGTVKIPVFCNGSAWVAH